MTNNQGRNQGRKPNQRSGMAILLVLIFLMVITAIVGAMLRYLVLNNRQTKQRLHATQAFWLADSGIERAVFLLRQNSDYRNETWIATADPFAGRTGQVEILVEAIPDDLRHVKVSVLATFPTNSTFAVKARRAIMVEIPAKERTVAPSTEEVDQDERA